MQQYFEIERKEACWQGPSIWGHLKHWYGDCPIHIRIWWSMKFVVLCLIPWFVKTMVGIHVCKTIGHRLEMYDGEGEWVALPNGEYKIINWFLYKCKICDGLHREAEFDVYLRKK